MKKVAHIESKWRCSFCDWEVEDWQKADMAKHEEKHYRTQSILPGQIIHCQFDTEGDDMGHSYSSYYNEDCLVIEVNVKELCVLVETKEKERKWAFSYRPL